MTITEALYFITGFALSQVQSDILQFQVLKTSHPDVAATKTNGERPVQILSTNAHSR